MTAGVAKTLVFGGALYAVYLVDRSVAAKNNDVGLLTKLFTGFLNEGMSNDELHAVMEASRNTVMEHYELKQRPIQRVIYPEYKPSHHVWMLIFRGANLANPYGLTAQDKTARTRRAKSMWE
jgi:hypothetical protein